MYASPQRFMNDYPEITVVPDGDSRLLPGFLAVHIHTTIRLARQSTFAAINNNVAFRYNDCGIIKGFAYVGVPVNNNWDDQTKARHILHQIATGMVEPTSHSIYQDWQALIPALMLLAGMPICFTFDSVKTIDAISANNR